MSANVAPLIIKLANESELTILAICGRPIIFDNGLFLYQTLAASICSIVTAFGNLELLSHLNLLYNLPTSVFSSSGPIVSVGCIPSSIVGVTGKLILSVVVKFSDSKDNELVTTSSLSTLVSVSVG